MVMSSLLNFSVGLGAVRLLMLHDCKLNGRISSNVDGHVDTYLLILCSMERGEGRAGEGRGGEGRGGEGREGRGGEGIGGEGRGGDCPHFPQTRTFVTAEPSRTPASRVTG